jgi:hypothetical protein
MIDVIYHGDSAWHDATRSNHDRMLDLLRQNWPLQHYWRDRIETDQSCEFDRHGPCEVWRFYQRITNTRNPILLYLPSNLWFGAGAPEAVLAEMDLLINGDQDICFMGSDFKQGFSDQHRSEPIDKHQRLSDMLIMCRRCCINNQDQAMQNLRSGKQFKDVSRSWPAVISDASRARSVRCQMYLVQRSDRELSDWRVGWDYLRSVDHSDEALTWWALQRPQRS